MSWAHDLTTPPLQVMMIFQNKRPKQWKDSFAFTVSPDEQSMNSINRPIKLNGRHHIEYVIGFDANSAKHQFPICARQADSYKCR